MRVGILTFGRKHGRKTGTIGSSILRGHWLQEHWEGSELWTEGRKFDAILFQKVYWKEYFDVYDGVKILDLCDPDWLGPDLQLREISDKVDAITCSSKGIYEYVKKIVNVPIYFIPDRVNFNFFNEPKQHIGKAETVVWFGYYHNAKVVLPQVLPSLKRLGLKLLVISNEAYDPMTDYGVDIESRPFDWQTLKWDITFGDMLINPQPIEGKFVYKSDNKTFIGQALGMPVAQTADDMKRFLDPDERNKEAAEKLEVLHRDFDVKKSVEEFKSIIENIYAKRGSQDKG